MNLILNQMDLSALPNSRLMEQARTILDGLSNGESHHQHQGKRMHYDRAVISIPIGYRYRLLLLCLKGRYVPLEIMSHEQYNNTKTIQQRVKHSKQYWSH
jgi:hypothetical protein